MNARAARALAALYPRAWRREYGAEFTDLLQHTPLTARVVADVAGHAGVAHLLLAGHLVAMSLGSIVVRPLALCWRVVGYVHSDDLHAVYGDDPNGNRDPGNVSGSMAANASLGFGG